MDKMVEALLLAEEFIANELENREEGNEGHGPESWPYAQEARDVLARVREALKTEDDNA